MQNEVRQYTTLGTTVLIISWGLLVMNIYYFGFPFFHNIGLEHKIWTDFMLQMRHAGLFSSQYKLKLWAEAIAVLSHLIKTHTPTDMKWAAIAGIGIAGLLMYFLPIKDPLAYILCTPAGFLMFNGGIALAIRKFSEDTLDEPDEDETFAQETKKKNNKYSINIPYTFRYKKKNRKGWINVVNPFRAVAVYGTPGAGKSFSVYGHFLRQMVKKQYAMFVYDFKYPDLTLIVYNLWLKNKDKFKKETEFLVINFNDARFSNRCNPIHPRYIKEPADTTEIADLVMLNVNKAALEKQDFFTESAKMYLDVILYFLFIYKEGRYCTFPHAIELMSQPYKHVFKILEQYPQLRSKLTAFVDAMKDNAQEQLQGQIASARIPLGKFTSPSLYWVLSGDEIDLNINDPQKPKFLCVGNDPNRQTIYGTTLALIVSRMFRQVNQKKRHHCAVLLDELPTIFLKGLDNLIATARANKVAIVIGAQDKSQLRRDYGDKESEVIFNTIGSYFSGQVKGKTAEDFSKEFGKIKRKQKSVSVGDSSSTSTSYHEEDMLPLNKITNLSQGQFFGAVADSNDNKIKQKMFFGDIYVDVEAVLKEESEFQEIPQIAFFEEDDAKAEIEEKADDKIFEYVQTEILKDAPVDEYGEPDWDKIEIDTNERIEKMDDEEKNAILEILITANRKKRRDKIIEENFNKIQMEAQQLVETEYAPLAEKEKREKKLESAQSRNARIASYIKDLNESANKS